MIEANRTHIRRITELRDASYSGESSGDGEKNFGPQLIDRRMTSLYVDRKIKAIVAPKQYRTEVLIRSFKVFSERIFGRLTKETRLLNGPSPQVDVTTHAEIQWPTWPWNNSHPFSSFFNSISDCHSFFLSRLELWKLPVS